jgi:hypothetical protein
MLKNWVARLLSQVDFEKGGKQGAPKFPVPVFFQLLLENAKLEQNEKATQAVKNTLDEMRKGGIYDHIGGGFARYSTDTEWKVPHFEKMLYDNALLVSLYSKAFQYFHDSSYLKTISETLNFIESELADEQGGFYSSINADSEGEEGRFYFWEYSEVEKTLDKQQGMIMEFYNIKPEGNWEKGKNILYQNVDENDFISELGLNKKEWTSIKSSALGKLKEKRNQRMRPETDKKIISSWNSMMVSGYLDAYMATGNAAYLKKAENALLFIEQNLISDNQIYRTYLGQRSDIQGFLDDYAFTIMAMINMFEATAEERWLLRANELTAYTLEHFYDDNSGCFFYSSDESEELIVRKKELNDNVIPSSNSVMAKNLFLLGTLLYDENYMTIYRQMLERVYPDMSESPEYFYNWVSALQHSTYPFFEIAIVGEDFSDKLLSMNGHFIPNAVFLGSKKESSLDLLKNKFVEGKTLIYVCLEKSCKLPTADVDQALQQLN